MAAYLQPTQAGDDLIGLTAWQKRALQSMRTTIVEDLHPAEVIDHMIADLVLDIDTITARTRREQNKELLEFVQRSNLKCLKSFLRALNSDFGRRHLAHSLKQALASQAAEAELAANAAPPAAPDRPAAAAGEDLQFSVQATQLDQNPVMACGDRGTRAEFLESNLNLRRPHGMGANGHGDDENGTSVDPVPCSGVATVPCSGVATVSPSAGVDAFRGIGGGIDMVDSGATAEDTQYDCDSFNRTISLECITEIMSQFGTWILVAKHLGLKPHDLDEVKHNNPPLTEQVALFLERWRNHDGKKATYRRLLEALKKSNKSLELIQFVERFAMAPTGNEE